MHVLCLSSVCVAKRKLLSNNQNTQKIILFFNLSKTTQIKLLNVGNNFFYNYNFIL